MKVYAYDIENSDKGIIFAENYKNAKQIFVENYPEADPDNYDYADVNQDRYDHGARIDELCGYDGGEGIVFICD